ncbi:acetyltransferase [Rheinheimera sp.]|uniref:acetyltransferase n=1 Tax=Rheinheimera sp. TaxID=1869214 RepID=UPI0025EED113|nr:acetyltransferase [Rheinheimera sp.]
MTNLSTTKKLVMIGAGGHARVLLDILSRQNQLPTAIFCAEKAQLAAPFASIKQYHQDEQMREFSPNDVLLVNAVGRLPGEHRRMQIFDKFKAMGYQFASVISEKALVSAYCSLGEGVQILDGSIVNTGVQIAENCIVNTAAVIEHDCKLDAHVMVAPGAVLCGNVHCAEQVFIGAGATVIQNIAIGKAALVAAGATLVCDLLEQQKVYPARHFIVM